MIRTRRKFFWPFLKELRQKEKEKKLQKEVDTTYASTEEVADAEIMMRVYDSQAQMQETTPKSQRKSGL